MEIVFFGRFILNFEVSLIQMFVCSLYFTYLEH